MINRSDGRLHGTDNRVAADAGRVRALKRTAGMTAITGDRGMRTVKLKSRAEMIEWLLCRRGRDRRSKQQRGGDNRTDAPQ